MYARSAAVYDAIYGRMKHYGQEAQRVRDLVRKYGRSSGNRLLDVACGTGLHLEHLREHFEVEGLEIAPQMREIAERRLPGVTVHDGDMERFDLGSTFDVVTCLFSAIGYMHTQEALERAVACFSRHTVPGGVVMIEPWIMPENFIPGYLGIDVVDEPDMKLARFSSNTLDGELTRILLRHAILTREGYETFDEEHALRLASHEQYVQALERAGLHVHFDPEGPMGRGMFIGVRPPDVR